MSLFIKGNVRCWEVFIPSILGLVECTIGLLILVSHILGVLVAGILFQLTDEIALFTVTGLALFGLRLTENALGAEVV